MTTIESHVPGETVTPGPWGWFGNAEGNCLYLATIGHGRRFVMDFVRWGMRRAQPRFQVKQRLGGGIMVPAKDLVKFEVGDGRAVGYEQAKDNRTVYRYDISAIDHPDARAIEKAPCMLAMLKRVLYTCHLSEDETLHNDIVRLIATVEPAYAANLHVSDEEDEED